MGKIWVFTVLVNFLSLVYVAYSDWEVLPHANSTNPKYTNHCEVPVDGQPLIKYYPVGTYQVKGQCRRVHCDKDFWFELETCPTITADDLKEIPHCRKTKYDYKKPFPDCCPRVLCKNKDGTERNATLDEFDGQPDLDTVQKLVKEKEGDYEYDSDSSSESKEEYRGSYEEIDSADDSSSYEDYGIDSMKFK